MCYLTASFPRGLPIPHRHLPGYFPSAPDIIQLVLLLLHQLEDGGDSGGLQRPVPVLQPLGKAVFGEVLAAEEGILGGSPVVPLNSFQPLD